jgi:hypothetical protein
MAPLDVGAFPLTSVEHLPNVTVAFPGEHWSDRKASEIIVPGEAVMPVNSGGRLYVRRAASGDVGSRQLGIALRTVQVPDINPGSVYTQPLGPNEIMNLAIPVGEYVHVYYSGAFHLTLVTPAAYVPGDLIGWDDAGARPTGKPGTGAWAKVTDEASALFELIKTYRSVNADNEGILTVRSLRGQF